MTGPTRRFSVISDEDTDLGLRIAFATDDNRRVNQHFGSAKAFAIYSVSPSSFSLITMAEFDELGDLDNEDKLAAKLSFLDGCVAVYCRACGSSAVRQLLEKHIQPLKVPEDSCIKELLHAFQQELKEGPSNWLAKAIRRQQSADGFNLNDLELGH